VTRSAMEPLPSDVRTLLCDADDTLFPSEELAFEASTAVTNRFLAKLGADRAFTPSELRAAANGKNFRATASELARAHGHPLDSDQLEWWVEEERQAVTRHLRTMLAPDEQVLETLTALADRFHLAAVTSSASTRLDACLDVTGLSHLFPPDRRFSAESSLPRPTSKPDPAVYRFAGERIGITPAQAMAVEDSVNGVRSAVAAGFRTIGILQFVPGGERALRQQALCEAGAVTVIDDWRELLSVGDPVSAR
jgi:HAD superfamily hydrolase (TIGR01509 family)